MIQESGQITGQFTVQEAEDLSIVLRSGALPEHDVPSAAVVLEVADPEAVHLRLRLGSPSVFARVKDDSLWLDMRTVTDPRDLQDLVTCVTRAINP